MTQPRVRFNLTLHGHQPVGNLPQVMEWCYAKCYGPFLEMMERFPAVRFTYHLSGCLLEWLLAERPKHVDLLRRLVARGQVELLGGAFYEPVLTGIPRRDALAQIQMQRQFYREQFGTDSHGVWIAERVWEPSLPSLLAGADVRFTLLDDTHFRAAGLPEEALHGYFLTEDQGRMLALFPILKSLRYTIPFSDVEASVRILREVAEREPGTMLAYGDDVEKFGVWPETYRLCFEDGWLERFLAALEANASWLELVTLAESLDTLPPQGLVYPPETSYVEMNEWALPAAMGPVCARLRRAVRDDPDLAPALPFVRGASWRNFRVKYPEIRRLYGRALHISRKMAALPDAPAAREARRELYRGQCNCPYWHGIFGGHYLPHLREAVWRHLLQAERLAEAVLEGDSAGMPALEQADVDLDGRDETVARNGSLALVVAPLGGRVIELDLRPWGLNLFSVLARRKEAYHEALLRLNQDVPAEARSIHDVTRAKDASLAEALHYDRYEHLGFTDLILDAEPDPQQFITGAIEDAYGLHSRTWRCQSMHDAQRAVVTLTLEAPDLPLGIAKTFHLEDRQLVTRYAVLNRGAAPWEGCFAVELPVALQTGSSPRRVYLDRRGGVLGPLGTALSGVEDCVRIADWDHDLELVLDAGGARILSYAVRTVSQSEAGFEGVHQHAVCVLTYRLSLPPGQRRTWEIVLTAQHAPVDKESSARVPGHSVRAG